jgi:DeoR/GlpR family transcriptional regulator of sugar metabolism
MLAQQRRSRILAELDRDGSVRVSDLVLKLGVSDMTVRRDLQALQHQGLLDKVHGGATARAEPSSLEPTFEVKSGRRLAEKEAIAARAAELVAPGSAIAVSAGTTTHAFARHLAEIPSLTVITNSVWVSDVLHRSSNDTLTVLLTGGIRTPSDALVGPLAVAALAGLHLDTFFLGVHGMDPVAGFSTPNLLEAETNRAMLRASQRCVVLADSSKWGIVGLASMAALSDADTVVTDSGLPAQASARLFEHVSDVVLVEPTVL